VDKAGKEIISLEEQLASLSAVVEQAGVGLPGPESAAAPAAHPPPTVPPA
jgi:hypothetical protein